MKLLVIAQHIGRTAPGRVFEALIREISCLVDIDVICQNYNPTTELNNINTKIIFKEPKFINPRFTTYMDRLFNIFFGVSWRDWRIGSKNINLNDCYDGIIALGSSGCLSSFQLAYKLKDRLRAPIFAYLVDACPTPYWWNPPAGQSGVKRFLKRVSSKFDFFASSNPKMLAYQKQYLAKGIKKLEIIYTPSLTTAFSEPKRDNNIIFTYIGSIYGLRNIKYLIEGFCMFVKEYPSSKLVFVGSDRAILKNIPENLHPNIEIAPFTDNLERYYQESTALIDLDADFDEDIFLSSKFSNYIYLDRPIICETGKGSPVRTIAHTKQSIILCNHNSVEIFTALKKCISTNFEYLERDDLKKIFSPIYNAEKIIRILKIGSR